jgi:hypothetical protein
MEIEKFPKTSRNYVCEKCNITTSSKKDYNNHLLTRKHLKNFPDSSQNFPDSSQNFPIISQIDQNSCPYVCEYCNIITNNKKDFSNHILTRKHLNKVRDYTPNIEVGNSETEGYTCQCGKEYKCNGSLWRHKKTCNPEMTSNKKEKPMVISTEIVMAIINQNKELHELLREERKMIIEEIKKSNNGNNIYANTISNNTNIQNTSNNANFNLNFFLNEQCKNAVNLTEFIESLVVTAEDFERTGKLGFVDGISKIFLKGLRELDVYSRPIHCTDLKRESIYVKHDNVWVKEDSEKTHLNTAVKHIARKNLRQLVTWKEENPDCLDNSTRASDLLVTYSQRALGGMGEQEDSKFRGAIIKNVLKDVVVGK